MNKNINTHPLNNKAIYCLIIMLVLNITACSSTGIKYEDFSQLKNKSSGNEENSFSYDDALFQIEYMIDEIKYKYQTFFIEDTYRYIDILYKDDIIISNSVITNGEATEPNIYRCTYFPPNYNIDVKQCFKDFTEWKINHHSQDILSVAAENDEEEERKLKRQTADAYGHMIGFFYITIPAAIIMGPYFAYENSVENDTIDNFKLTLGSNISDIQYYLNDIPDSEIEIINGTGTFYISTHISYYPVIAVGVEDNKIMWTLKRPIYDCSKSNLTGDFSCTLGDTIKGDGDI